MNTEEKQYTLHEIIEQSFDFSVYSADEKEAVIDETTGMLMEATILRLLEESNQEIQEKFATFIETHPDELAMTEFITENFPNFGEILGDEIRIFKSMGENTETATAE